MMWLDLSTAMRTSLARRVPAAVERRTTPSSSRVDLTQPWPPGARIRPVPNLVALPFHPPVQRRPALEVRSVATPPLQRKKVEMADGGVFESDLKVELTQRRALQAQPGGMTAAELIAYESGLSEDDILKMKRDFVGASASMRLQYTLPTRVNGVHTVGLVQVTKPTIKRRGSGQESFAAVRAKGRITEEGWYFDRQTGERHPVFGMGGMEEGTQEVDYDALAGAEKPNDARSQYGTATQPATLYDRPSRISGPLPFEHEFQTAALVVGGDTEQLGSYLGVVSWGYQYTGKKAIALDIEGVRDTSLGDEDGLGGLTQVFRDAVDGWNAEEKEGGSRQNVQLPTDRA